MAFSVSALVELKRVADDFVNKDVLLHNSVELSYFSQTNYQEWNIHCIMVRLTINNHTFQHILQAGGESHLPVCPRTVQLKLKLV